MGGMDDMRNKADEIGEKAKGARRRGSEQPEQGMRRGGEEASERSGGRLDEQSERGQEQGRQRMDQDANDELQDDWS
jgi:hypothetical protein